MTPFKPFAPFAPFRALGATVNTLAKIIAGLFSDASAIGLWCESGLNLTQFQDSEGTIPATFGQLVGRVLDKSGKGKTLIQPTPIKRPVLSARVNLLIKTEDFTDPVWDRGPSLQANGRSGTINGYPAYSFTSQAAGNSYLIQSCTLVPGQLYTFEFLTDTDTGGASYSVTATGARAFNYELLSPGVYRASFSVVADNTNPVVSVHIGRIDAPAGTTFRVAAPQVARSAVPGKYQRVNTDTDYDTVGWPTRLEFDAVDDALTATFATAPGSNVTIGRSIPGVGAQILTGQTVGTTYTITESFAALVMVNRPLTAFETKNLTDYLNERAGVDVSSYVPVAPDAAIQSMFSYSGGKNGAYLDLQDMPAMRQGQTKASAPVTASGQYVGRVIDKSANDNDVYSLNGLTESGTFITSPAGFKEVSFNTGFISSTGGGSGENPTSGFSYVGLFEPKDYYHCLWSDRSAANTGRELIYDPDEGGMVFSVGTGSNRIKAIVRNIAPLYNLPPAGTKLAVSARHEGNSIFLKVDAFTEATATVPTFAAGSNNFSVSKHFDSAGESVGLVALSVHVFDPLTAPIRAAAVAYVATKKP